MRCELYPEPPGNCFCFFRTNLEALLFRFWKRKLRCSLHQKRKHRTVCRQLQLLRLSHFRANQNGIILLVAFAQDSEKKILQSTEECSTSREVKKNVS